MIIAILKGLIKVGRWANEHKHAAAVILSKQTYYLDVEDTYEGIKHVEMLPVLSLYNLQALQINKDFMLSHGYIEHDFDVYMKAANQGAKEGGGLSIGFNIALPHDQTGKLPRFPIVMMGLEY